MFLVGSDRFGPRELTRARAAALSYFANLRLVFVSPEPRVQPDPMKHLKRYPKWLYICLAAAAVLCAIGLRSMDGFAASAVASGAAILVSIPVTVYVIEDLLSRRRDEFWKLVRQQTGSSIEGLSQQAAIDFHHAISPERRRDIPSPVTTPSGGHAAVLRRLEAALRSREGDPDPAVIRLHDNLQQPLHHLEAMAPRIYATDDPELARRFGEVETQARAWERARHLYGYQQPGVLWTDAADTALAMARLVEHAHLLRSETQS